MHKASVAFVASTDPDVHFKCYISADCKIQAAIKHEREVQTIHRKTWFHSSLSINQSINQSFNVSNSRYKPELQERSETANISSIGI